MELYLIRHGKTAGNLEHRYIGCRSDEELTPQAMKEIPSWDLLPRLCFISPMKRCRQTAEALLGDCRLIEIPELAEMDFGEFEGKNYRELSSDPRYQAWIDGGGIAAFPGGESRQDFIDRCSRGFQRMLTCMAEQPSGPYAALVHGGTIMAIMSSLTGGDYFDYQLPCLQGYHLKFSLSTDGFIKEEGEVRIYDLAYERVCPGLSH